MTEDQTPPPVLIRITVERDAYTGWTGQQIPARTIVREFTDIGMADSWLTGDSYVAEPYTRRLTWERIR